MVLKAWITGKEAMKIDAPFTNLKMTLDTNGVGKGEVNAGEAISASQKAAIEVVVVSIDGKTENIYEQAISLRKSDFQFLLQEIDKVVKDKDFPLPVKTQGDGID